MQLEIPTLKHQKEFILSKAKHTILVGGYGSGKSHSAVTKTFIKKLQMPKVNVAYYLPTYGLIRDVAYPKFEEILTRLEVPFSLNKQDNVITTSYGKIMLRNMSDPATIVGYDTGYSLIDETDILPKDKMSEAFIKIIGRNRSKVPKGMINQTDVVGTPEGFKWLYEFAVKEHNESKLVIKAKSTDNPYLPKDYIDTLRETYTEAQVEAYINGEFINLTSGSVYVNYNRKAHRTEEVAKPNEMLYIGLDFNITNMNAVVHVLRDKKLYAVNEIAGSYDTQSTCDSLRTIYPNNRIIINPDASGKSRSSSGASDFDILRQNGFEIVSPRKNPNVKERVNAVNLAFQNGVYFVNDKMCPSYAEALENQSYKGGVPDKASGFDHITEAGGYCVYKNLFGRTSQVT